MSKYRAAVVKHHTSYPSTQPRAAPCMMLQLRCSRQPRLSNIIPINSAACMVLQHVDCRPRACFFFSLRVCVSSCPSPHIRHITVTVTVTVTFYILHNTQWSRSIVNGHGLCLLRVGGFFSGHRHMDTRTRQRSRFFNINFPSASTRFPSH